MLQNSDPRVPVRNKCDLVFGYPLLEGVWKSGGIASRVVLGIRFSVVPSFRPVRFIHRKRTSGTHSIGFMMSR
jgi:hypothetical protein